MPIFGLRKIIAVAGKQDFFELLIDNESQFEKYFEEVKTNSQYYSEFKTILAYMNLVAELRMIPKEKFKDITPEKDKVKEYEFKSKHLRVYVFHLEKTGKIVTWCGFKNTQQDDISNFRSIKRRFLNSLAK